MATMRIEARLNPGGEGVRPDKLARISDALEEFLRSLAMSGQRPRSAGLIAKDFYNPSAGYAVEFTKPVDRTVLHSFNDGVEYPLEEDKIRSKGCYCPGGMALCRRSQRHSS